METIYYALVAMAFFLAIGNWRAGVYACVVFDGLRDPIRKLCADQPVAITIAVGFIWLGVFLGMMTAHRADLRDALRHHYPKVRAATKCFIAALIPGALISLVLYDRGYMLALLGGVSYIAPLMGLAIGYVYPRRGHDVDQLLAFYVVFNSIVLIGAPLQYSGSDIPGLGGLSMDWIRQMHGLHVDLISGFYRSPDVLGLHAAYVVVFSTILTLRAKGPGRLGWSTLAIWAGMCLLLAGRRKMIAIPLIYAASYFLLGLRSGSRMKRRGGIAIGLAALVCAAVLILAYEAEISSDYTDYASTLVTQGRSRSNEVVVASSIITLQQSGLLGDGLGTATQGSHYLDVKMTRKGWQEAGGSRLFKELGLPGVALMGMAFVLFLQGIQRALKLVPAGHHVADMQVSLLGFVVANLACFIAAHQVYSGDPSSSLLVVSLLGMVFGLPRILWNECEGVASGGIRDTGYALRDARRAIRGMGCRTGHEMRDARK